MISLVYKNKKGELDTMLMCKQSKVIDLVKQLDDIKEYNIVSSPSQDYTTSSKLAELDIRFSNFKQLCRNPDFNGKLSEDEKNTIQKLFDAYKDVYDNVL